MKIGTWTLPARPDARPTGLIRGGMATLALAFAVLPAAAWGQAPASPRDQVVWHWFGACVGRDSMVLEVSFDGGSVYSTAFPMCQQRRAQIQPERQQRLLEFHFEAPPRRFGPHSRVAEPQRIEGTIWETGGEPGAVLLGLSIAAGDQVLLNVHYTARMDAASRSERVRGLVIATHPVRPRK